MPNAASSPAASWKYKTPEGIPETMKWTLVLLLGCSFIHGTKCWTSHQSSETMSWTAAQLWCRSKYTDMVIIRSFEDNAYVESQLQVRGKSPYYWIGLKRSTQNQTWTWVGNNSTWVDQSFWAEKEPNNNQSVEACVEMYVSNKDTSGQWNDDTCSSGKYAVCHKAQCTAHSCERGTCVELPGNITCRCEDGFEGERCQTAVACSTLAPPDGSLTLDRMNNTIESTCPFQCLSGLLILGAPEVTGGVNGTLSGPRPHCADYKRALIAVLAFGVVSACCCCLCCCWRKHRKRNTPAYVRGLE